MSEREGVFRGVLVCVEVVGEDEGVVVAMRLVLFTVAFLVLMVLVVVVVVLGVVVFGVVVALVREEEVLVL